MTQANSTGPTDPSQPQQPPPPGPEPKKKRRRRWPYVIGAILLLLILLVLLLPTIASTAPVRSAVVNAVNENLNGKLDIKDWSIGWTSGVTLDAIKIEDQQGRRVLEVGSVRMPASLIGLARGNLDLGEIVIDKPSVNVELYADGTSNLDHLMKQDPAAKKESKPKQSGEDEKLPDIKGKITINDLQATISGENIGPPVQIDPSNFVINIPSINAPIENSGKITYRVGSAPASTITIAGTVDAVENNQVDLDKLTADQKVEVANADFAAAAPFLKKSDPAAVLAGIANGSLQIKAKGLKDASVKGQFDVANFAFSGAALKGDTIKSTKIAIPIDVATAAAGNETQITIQTLKVETDQALVDVKGQLTKESLDNLAANKAPGSDGNVVLTVNTKDLPGLIKSLPNTLAMQKGVEITGGKVAAQVDVKLAKDNATIKQVLDLDAAGTSAGKPIKLDPVHLDTAVTAIPAGGAIPDLRDLVVNLTSAFATAKGGGKSIADVDIKGDLDLAKLHAQLVQFVDLQGMQFAGAGTFGVTSKGDLTKTGGTSDVGANLTLTNVVVRGLKDRGDLNEPRLALAANARIVRGAEAFIENIPSAKVTLQSGDPQALVVDLLLTAEDVSPDGRGVEKYDLQKLHIPDLARMQQQFAAFIPPDIRLVGGSISTTASGTFDNDTLSFSKKTQLSKVTIQQITPGAPPKAIVQDESDEITADGRFMMSRDGAMSASIELLTVTGNLARAKVEKARLQLARGGEDKDKPLPVWDMLQTAKIEVAVPDINRVMKLIPPSTQPTPPSTQPALEIGGGAVVNAEITRDAASQTTRISVPQIAASKVSLVRGKRSYVFDKVIALKLNADLATAGDEMKKIDVKELSGDLGGLATLSMPTPIAVSDLSAKDKSPSAAGKVALVGDIEPLTRLLSVVQDADPMPYRGDYAIAQTISTDSSNAIKLAGDATVNRFIVLQADGKTPAFSEDKIVLANDLVADTNSKTATINSVALTMPSSQAAGLLLKGKVSDWEEQRKLEGVTCDLSYDLAKLWPMVKPMLAPETQEQFKDLKTAGQFKRTFNVGGKYPATTQPGENPIKYLTADGALAVQLLDTSGINVQNLELPLSLVGGQLITLYMNKPKAERAAKPAAFNGGTMDLNSIVVDLNGDTPRLTIGKNQKLVAGASINSLLGDTLGKFVNPVFANSQRAKGLLDVTIVECNNLALGEKLKSPESGSCKIVFSLTDMDIANPVGQLMLGPIISAVPGFSGGVSGQADAFQGYIKDATITIANGRTTQNVTMMLVDPGSVAQAVGGAAGEKPKPVYMPLTFQGDINLVDLAQSLNVSFPAQLVAKFIPDHDIKRDFIKIFPSGIPIAMRGTTTKPKVDVGNIGKQIAEGLIKSKIGDVIPGVTAPGGTPQKPEDILGGVLDRFGKKKEDEKPKQPAQPAPAPKKKK